jgi:hypothetical protein
MDGSAGTFNAQDVRMRESGPWALVQLMGFKARGRERGPEVAIYTCSVVRISLFSFHIFAKRSGERPSIKFSYSPKLNLRQVEKKRSRRCDRCNQMGRQMCQLINRFNFASRKSSLIDLSIEIIKNLLKININAIK